MLPHIVMSMWSRSRGRARSCSLIGYIFDILSVMTFILPASSAFILSIHVPDTGSTLRSIAIAIGFAIAIEISRLSETKSKIAVWIESPPCRPGWETESIFIQ